MKPSLAAARQAQAAESVAADVVALKEQLTRIESTLETLLEALARDNATNAPDSAESEPKRRGRPARSEN